jgi:hypothetical protein
MADECDPKEKSYNELVDFSFYVATTEMRQRCRERGAEVIATNEALLDIAHFMLRNCAWDPYKQSLLAISLIESEGEAALRMWEKVLNPLEKVMRLNMLR